MGELYQDDLDFMQLDHLKEAARLRGTTVLLFDVVDMTRDIYTDIEVKSLPHPYAVDVLFETYPQNKKTLNQYGWYNKDSDTNPIVMFMPLDTDIQRWQKILIPGKIFKQATGWRKYEITDQNTRMVHPHFYVLAVAPVYRSVAPQVDRTKNSNFLQGIDFSAKR